MSLFFRRIGASLAIVFYLSHSAFRVKYLCGQFRPSPQPLRASAPLQTRWTPFPNSSIHARGCARPVVSRFGEAQLADYRLYFHDRAGRFARSEELTVDDDGAAMDHARALGHQYDVEIWEGKRKVAIVPPAPGKD